MTAPGRTVAGRSARGSRVLEDVVPGVAVLGSLMDRRVSIHRDLDTSERLRFVGPPLVGRQAQRVVPAHAARRGACGTASPAAGR